MKQYFLCPKCKKRVVQTSSTQWTCPKCKKVYNVPNYQRISMIIFNIIIAFGLLVGLMTGLVNLR